MTAPLPAVPAATRVNASQHSQIYRNAFSIDTAGVETLESVPRQLRQPMPCCPRPGCCISEDRDVKQFREVLELDLVTQTLLAGTGFTFGEIEAVLKPAGLILEGAPNAVSISLGGALATSSHSNGLTVQPLSAYLLDVWIQNAQDHLVHISRADEAFGTAAFSLGLLGPIVRVRIQCFKRTRNRLNMRIEMPTYSGAELDNANPANTTGFRYAMYKKKLIRIDAFETDREPSPPACGGCLEPLSAAACPIYTVDAAVGCLPCLACLTGQDLATPGSTVVDKTETFSSTPTAPVYEIHYAVPVADAAACFDELTAVIDANKKAGRYISYQFLSRFIGAVDAKWALAISAGGDKLTFEFSFSKRQRGVRKFISELVPVLQKYRGRPHLGKTIWPEDIAYAAQVYGSANGGAPFLAFEAVRQEFDPHGRFLNPTLREFVTTAKAAAEGGKATRDGFAVAHDRLVSVCNAKNCSTALKCVTSRWPAGDRFVKEHGHWGPNIAHVCQCVAAALREVFSRSRSIAESRGRVGQHSMMEEGSSHDGRTHGQGSAGT